ncbi:hypothetical protein OPIT5_02265 [Opitutaceae bacterium TAV5]|nr:hypothetical protein OPIT5_02265 [Opitutaceae bacterium TAV5]
MKTKKALNKKLYQHSETFRFLHKGRKQRKELIILLFALFAIFV